MTTLRLKPASGKQQGSGSSVGDALDAAITGRLGASDVSTTTGVKGLDEEDLQNARPNTEELERMESNRVSDSDASGYAHDLKLKPQKVDYLVDMENVLPTRKTDGNTGE
jgi:hypothetical protein